MPGLIRSYPIRYRSLFIIFRCVTDPIRSDTGAYTSSTPTALILSDPIPEIMHPFTEGIRSYTEDLATSAGMDPILSDPTPKLLHPLTAWIRSYPIRYRSLHPFFRNGSDSIRSDTVSGSVSVSVSVYVYAYVYVYVYVYVSVCHCV
jgi:hypothetical protein